MTIIELVIFIVIIGIAAAALLQVLNLASRNSVDPLRRKQATLIAEAFMEEVQQAQFTVCDPGAANAATANVPGDCGGTVNVKGFGPLGTGPRPYYNITDYVPSGYVAGSPRRAFAVTDSNGNLVDTDVAGNPLGASAVGGLLGKSGLEGITTTLALNPVVTLNGLASTASNMIVLQITITTTYAPGQSIVLEGYRTRYAPGAR
ncbi:type II secretion system protein [Duganella sp. CY42W]|uniref:Type II secretion system protein n=1 Tax=Duganella levis TaxID=2692169 RepID=A0ABW9W7H2_9BURK|nr:type II secretion system protein [Duganella levis]